MTPLNVAQAFTRAWTSQDFDTARQYVDEDVIFDGPMQHSTGAEAYFTGLTGLSKSVKELRMIAAFGDDDTALLMYDLVTDPYGVLTCAKLISVRNGKIVEDRLTFDSFIIRNFNAAPATR